MKSKFIQTKNFVTDATEFISQKAEEAIAKRGRFVLSLCGGKTPESIYTELGKQKILNWEKIIITFGDERCVSSTHPESNFGMVQRTLFDQIHIPKTNIHRIQGELPPEEAAQLYESELMNLKSCHEEPALIHDLILLGLGDDGHTASLFPETTALFETNKLVVSNYVPKFKSNRITFTYPLINTARHICFLVNDSRKQPVIEDIKSGNSHFPAAKVTAAESLTWLIGS